MNRAGQPVDKQLKTLPKFNVVTIFKEKEKMNNLWSNFRLTREYGTLRSCLNVERSLKKLTNSGDELKP